jgi:hypothetical protein
MRERSLEILISRAITQAFGPNYELVAVDAPRLPDSRSHICLLGEHAKSNAGSMFGLNTAMRHREILSARFDQLDLNKNSRSLLSWQTSCEMNYQPEKIRMDGSSQLLVHTRACLDIEIECPKRFAMLSFGQV